MMKAKVINVENSIRVIPDDGYSIVMIDDAGNNSYADDFVQFPVELYDESKIDTIPTSDIPVPVPEIEVDSDTALNELTEVIDDDKR